MVITCLVYLGPFGCAKLRTIPITQNQTHNRRNAMLLIKSTADLFEVA